MSVLYLGTSPGDANVRDMLDHRRLGLMCQPGSNRPRAGWVWAADNGCFNAARWDRRKWERWLRDETLPRAGCLFATVPDVVGDHAATLARFGDHLPIVLAARYPIAFVAQDGATLKGVPWDDLDCLFIGGSTEWKMSEQAFHLAAAARVRGKWVHVGRVNSASRFNAWAPHANSCDGTYLAFGPTVNAPKVAGWMANAWERPQLDLTAREA